MMEKGLAISEIIAHCNRYTERVEKRSSRERLEETPIGNSERMKRYWEHRQVAELLNELLAYRAIGTVEEFKTLKEKAEPKKVTKEQVTIIKCPSCGSTDVFDYCGKCGTKLDRS